MSPFNALQWHLGSFGCSGSADHDPLHRSTLQTAALTALSSATHLDPTSAPAFYHLAQAQASCRQIEESILSIRSALELEPGMVRGWHLLTLLLTAKGKWEDAAKVADIGLDAAAEDASSAVDGGSHLSLRHGVAPSAVNGTASASTALLSATGHILKSASTSPIDARSTSCAFRRRICCVPS